MDPATLRVTMPHSLWEFFPLEQLEDGCVVPSSVQEGTGNRNKYAPDATVQGGCEVEVGDGKPHCTGLIDGVTTAIVEETPGEAKEPREVLTCGSPNPWTTPPGAR